MLKLVSLHNVSGKELVTVWNRCWHNSDQPETDTTYYKEAHLKAYCLIHKISLPDSVGLIESGNLIGFSLLGLNEKHGWIAFLGMLPGFRRKGLAKLLLDYQLSICDRLKTQCVSLEVNQHHFMLKVYQTFGFCCSTQLTNYILTDKDLSYLDTHRYYQYCYSTVLADQYFKARDRLKASFSWRRRAYIIRNYNQVTYYLGPNQASGYVINAGGILIDVWASSVPYAQSVLSSISEHLESNIVITNQIHDKLAVFLSQRLINPVSIQYEMIR